jgi:hypothetical protein
MIETKQIAMNLFETTREAFLGNCRWIARRIAEKQGYATIDDVRKNVTIPLGIDGRVMGAVFNTPDWEKTGYTTTKVKSSHGRPIAIFKLI